MNEAVLTCHRLAKSYRDGATKIEVLHDINLTVHQSEIIAVVGSSGSGKSTLLHLLAGLDRPTQGEVLIRGKKWQSLTERERCFMRNRYLGFIYQFHHLLPEFTAIENVAMPLLMRPHEIKNVAEKARELLAQVGLENRLQHFPSQLSGGERQRVAIARALIAEPLCVLADEPTGNLDPKNAEKVLELFFTLQKSRKTSIVMVTHAFSLAKRAERVLRIEDGRLVE